MGAMQQMLLVGGGAAPITEFVPTIKYAQVASSQTRNVTTYGSLLTFSVTTTSTSDCLNILMSACGQVLTAGNTPAFQITVDGSDIGQTCSTEKNGGGFFTVTRVASITGLSVGSHTVVLNWKSASANTVRIDPSNGTDHCSLVCRLGSGTVYVTRGSNATSTSTTVTDSLLSTTYTSVAASSALYIRFSTMGINNTAANTAKFQILVDGAGVCGTGDKGGGAAFGFCAGAVVVVPVTAGSHTVEVNWAGGGGSGSTITVSDLRQHAALLIDEVYTGSPRFNALATDVSSLSNTLAASTSITTPAGGVSDILVEATASIDEVATPSAAVKLDGTVIVQSKGGDSTTGTVGLFLTKVQTALSAAAHSVQLAVGGDSIDAASHPEYAHANLVVWPVTVQP